MQTPWRHPAPTAGGWRGPDVADVAITLAEAVQGVIALATGMAEAAESVTGSRRCSDRCQPC